MDANPEMKREGYMLQKGATLFIPYTKDQKNPNQVNGQKSGNGATVQKLLQLRQPQRLLLPEMR